MSSKIKVLIVDDDVLVRTCIRAHLNLAPEITVVGEAGQGDEALKLARETKPHVVLMDLMMPGISSIEVISRLIRIYSDLKVVVLTGMNNKVFPKRLLDIGVRGYLTKQSSADELIAAVLKVYNGARYITAVVAQDIAMDNINTADTSLFDELSKREFQIMMMIVNGYKVDYISDKLCLSPKTISSHRYAILTKLGVRNDVALTHLAINQGLIDVAPPEDIAGVDAPPPEETTDA